jgi:chromosome segregation ATPase
MNGTEEEASEAQAAEPSSKDFLKKHVRGIPREKMKDRKVYYGFKYKDLKGFIESLIGQYKDVESPELVAKISELELKLDTLQKQRAALKGELEEAKAAGPDTGEMEGLQADLKAARADKEALEAEKTALEARVQELDGLSGTADEQAQRAQDLAAELAALKEKFANLEKENDLNEEEMDRLEAANRELSEKLEALQRELDGLREASEGRSEAFDKERVGFQDRIGELENLLSASKDAQKLLEMQKEYAGYKNLLKAYETAAAESVDIEDRPDSAELTSRVEAVRARVPEDSRAAHVAEALASLYDSNESVVEKYLETMYEGGGTFRVILNLGKALIRSQQIAEGVRILDDVTSA